MKIVTEVATVLRGIKKYLSWVIADRSGMELKGRLAQDSHIPSGGVVNYYYLFIQRTRVGAPDIAVTCFIDSPQRIYWLDF